MVTELRHHPMGDWMLKSRFVKLQQALCRTRCTSHLISTSGSQMHNMTGTSHAPSLTPFTTASQHGVVAGKHAEDARASAHLPMPELA